MIFSSKPVSTSKLQKQLDVEKSASAPMATPDALWMMDTDGCDEPCQCAGRRVGSVRLGFPDPIPQGGEA